MNRESKVLQSGVVAAVRGSVVDMRFDGPLPAIHTLMRAGSDGQVLIEVLAQRDAQHVRGIALTPTQGLARGMPVEDTGGPLKAPVGKPILSRMFDVFGNTIDREPALSGVQWRSVHCQPPPLVRRSTKSEVFETGIKAIDVLTPLERGGKAGLFGGAGVGKTVLLSVAAQIAILLALNAALFDLVPLDRMAAAQRAVQDAAHALPDDVNQRLAAADQLTDADCEQVTTAARQALTPFIVPAPDTPASKVDLGQRA